MSEIEMEHILEFERPIHRLESQIKELEAANKHHDLDTSKEVSTLQKKVEDLIDNIYSNLSSWERVQLSRHPDRPHASDYINTIFTDFHELHGDRYFADDPALITGFAYLNGKKVAVLGLEKGRKTQDKIHRNFGMARPEGYRKALRIMKLAAQFAIPIITFVDTPGAYPGIDAEERGQAHAIAQNLEEMFGLATPIISVVIGEGGSGGALGIAVADKVCMMEYSVYSVISPESCASILWSDPKKAQQAADSLQLGPQKALELGIIDGIIAEPKGGAHRDKESAIELLKSTIEGHLEELRKLDTDKLLDLRYQKFRTMGEAVLLRTGESK